MAAASPTIRRTLMRMIFLSSGAVLALTIASFCTYELVNFRQSSVQQLRTLSRAIATNSTAALAFDNPADAATVLAAFRAEPHIVAAALYDAGGRLFATYPRGLPAASFPSHPGPMGYAFGHSRLTGFQPVVEDSQRLGTLFVQSDLEAMYARLRLYALIAALVIAASLPLAYLISRRLQQRLVQPILALADTARAVSDRHDYTVRAGRTGIAEFDLFTGTFNQMLTQVQQSDGKLQAQLARLGLLQHITRATGERQDLASIFQVVLGSLEENLPVDFGGFLLYDPVAPSLSISTLGVAGGFAAKLGLTEGLIVPIDPNGLSRCVAGQLVYEPDVQQVPFAFPQRLAGAGLRSVVIAPLIVENQVFGVLVCARARADAFSSGECEFLRQLSEHVALASHQVRLYGALQQAYNDLRQSQHTVMQQERLRALGQMASGIAHDINNAISPVSLYTESLLEREPGLSERARGYLVTIQRAIEDVARTVARMREFYREREAQMTLERVDLNRAILQVVDLTRPRWSDLPQQRGVMVDLRTELAASLPDVMGAEHEIRDALTNLIFNAVDAMPGGGTLVMRTRVVREREDAEDVVVEVCDSGIGMDEDTRRRCLEPFYTTKGERGTGLGLAMVYGMVQRHSAELQIDSAQGQGTTVRLTFPAYTASAVASARVARQPVTNRRLRILLVDDDPLLIKSLQDTLQEDGHQITATHGGQAGIDAFIAARQRGEGIDVVITDLGMPHVDGRKVASAVKQASPTTPVILLTGWGQRMIAANDTPAHVDKVLSKPPRLHELRAALAELTESAELVS
ncbi:MAG TPA: ATP-binding protein [Steroidobacteraceae bacterium]|jgi:signal transduction histidine kinase/CheY-like chemotaxis protein|nr:ATP-binding protein [Steroidobacteraceae bacterium]